MPGFYQYDKQFNLIRAKTTFNVGETMGDLAYLGNGFFVVASTTELVLWKFIGNDIVKLKVLHTPAATEPFRGVAYDGHQLYCFARDTVAAANRFRKFDVQGTQLTTLGIGTVEVAGGAFDGQRIYTITKQATNQIRRFTRGARNNIQQIDFIGSVGLTAAGIEYTDKYLWTIDAGGTIKQIDVSGNTIKQSAIIATNFSGIMTDGKSFFISEA